MLQFKINQTKSHLKGNILSTESNLFGIKIVHQIYTSRYTNKTYVDAKLVTQV